MGGAPRWPGVEASSSAARAAVTASRIAWAQVGGWLVGAAAELELEEAEGAAAAAAVAAAAAAAPIRPSFPPFAPLFLFHFRQAKVAQSRQRVLPVPVGDSSRALVPCFCEVVSVRVFFK